jgi:hypothetical protein
MLTGKLHRRLTALSILFSMSAAWAQDARQDFPTVGSLGYRIEIALHERLARTRASRSVTLTPFESDGCSGGLSAGWELLAQALPELTRHHGGQLPWQACCVTHDRAYHAGGGRRADARTSYEARYRADEQLRQCVIQTGKKRMPTLIADYGLSRDQVSTLYRTIADVMYRAVRLGGAPCTSLSWRWGFGWPRCD